MGGVVFPPQCLTWDQTVVEVMKIMMTSFKRSHTYTATLSAPDPVAGHRWPMPSLETPGHSQASLGQSIVESLLLSFHAKMGTIKDRNGMDLTEAEDIKKMWQEYTEELYKKKRSSWPR